jgi:hypothetical protein
MYVNTQAFQVQVRGTHGVKSWSMRDSHENLYMMEKNFVVNQQFSAEEEDAQGKG